MVLASTVIQVAPESKIDPWSHQMTTHHWILTMKSAFELSNNNLTRRPKTPKNCGRSTINTKDNLQIYKSNKFWRIILKNKNMKKSTQIVLHKKLASGRSLLIARRRKLIHHHSLRTLQENKLFLIESLFLLIYIIMFYMILYIFI